jgi:hypothetical protein
MYAPVKLPNGANTRKECMPFQLSAHPRLVEAGVAGVKKNPGRIKLVRIKAVTKKIVLSLGIIWVWSGLSRFGNGLGFRTMLYLLSDCAGGKTRQTEQKANPNSQRAGASGRLLHLALKEEAITVTEAISSRRPECGAILQLSDRVFQ